MSKYRFLKELKFNNFVYLSLAGVINSIGVTIFLTPLNLFDSGLSGTSFLFNLLTPQWFTLSFFLIILNFPFYLFAHKKLGFSFVIYSLYAILIYSVFAFIIQNVLPIDWTNGSPLVGDDKLLACIFGGLISGIGSGIVIRYGGAIDGIEVMSVIFSKKIGISVGSFIMIYNILLYFICAIIFRAWTIPLYSIIAYAVGLKAVDFVVEGLDRGKCAFIITNRSTEICEAISTDMQRGVTFWSGNGYYTKTEKTVLYVVVNRFEVMKLKAIVLKIDEKAFVAISDVSETMGVSFKFRKNSYIKPSINQKDLKNNNLK